jgi:hypothetical protein
MYYIFQNKTSKSNQLPQKMVKIEKKRRKQCARSKNDTGNRATDTQTIWKL